MVYDRLLELDLLNGIVLSSAVSVRHGNRHIYMAECFSIQGYSGGVVCEPSISERRGYLVRWNGASEILFGFPLLIEDTKMLEAKWHGNRTPEEVTGWSKRVKVCMWAFYNQPIVV